MPTLKKKTKIFSVLGCPGRKSARVHRSCFTRGEDHPRISFLFRTLRNVYINNFRAQLRQFFNRSTNRRQDMWLNIRTHKGFIPTNTYTRDSLGHTLRVVWNSSRQGCRVLRIVTRYHRQHTRRIFNTASHRPDMIQRRSQVQHTMATDPSPGRLKADDTVNGCWKANRATGIRA